MTVARTLLPMSMLVVLIGSSILRAEEDAVFRIQEESILDKEGGILTEYLRNGSAVLSAGPCSATPIPGVKYPKLISKSPLYGQVVFRSSVPALSTPSAARSFCFVVYSTDVTSEKHDVLYFDANGDRDLTNDDKVDVAEKPPTGLAQFGGIGGAASIFNSVELKGAAAEAATERFLPWMSRQNSRQSYLIFMSTVVRKGNIQLGPRTYEVLLGSRFQGSSARVMLRPADSPRPTVFKNVMLNRLQQMDSEFFTLSVDAAGRQLTVSPYAGEFGELTIKADDEAPEKLGLAARLYAKNGSSLSAGDFYAEPFQPQHRVPTGDYRANLMVDYGNTRVSLSTKGYDIPIRGDQPFQFEFADKPIVTFTTPKAGQVFRPGSQIRFKSMLRDPTTNMLVRGLYDTTSSTRQRTARNADGQTVSYPVYTSLVPTVVITDAAGKQIASGKMPFG